MRCNAECSEIDGLRMLRGRKRARLKEGQRRSKNNLDVFVCIITAFPGLRWNLAKISHMLEAHYERNVIVV